MSRLTVALVSAWLLSACGNPPSMNMAGAAVGGQIGLTVQSGTGGRAGAYMPTTTTAGFSGAPLGGSAGHGLTGAPSAGAPVSTGAAGVAGSIAGGGGVAPISIGGAFGAAGTSGATGISGSTGMSGAGGTSGVSDTGGSGGIVASPRKKFCGNITTAGQVRSDFAQYWDQITPENEGKWGSVESVRNQMNWSALDAVYNYAKQHKIVFKQHNFVWGSQQPSWLSGLSQDEQRAEVEEWIRLYCERYPDTPLIDVVNEPPPHTTPTYTAALGGAGTSGYDWIVQTFKWAHQYCPSSILILNDYNTIEYANDNSHFIDIVNRIKAAGAPIDAVGAQAHAAYNLPTATVKMYVDKLASSTGLPVYISEYDINEADDTQQKSVMASQFQMFWEDENVKGITLWGYVEGQTWLPNTGLMTSTGQMRPAMTWLLDFLHP